MSTQPGSTDPANVEPPNSDPTGQDPGAQDPAADEKVQLQLAIFEVARDAAGRSLDEIRGMLRSAFSRRGVQSPPGTWLDSVASAAYYGEPYIIDLPAALAADGEATASSEDVRRQLAARRRLRQEKLPPGIFPSPADWDVRDNEVSRGITGGRGHSRAVPRTTGGPRAVLVAAMLIAAAVVAVVAARASIRDRVTRPGHPEYDQEGQ